MKATIFDSASHTAGRWLSVEDVPTPPRQPGEVLLRVIACGVGRTDLHIVGQNLVSIRLGIVPGHRIVGEIAAGISLNAGLRRRKSRFAIDFLRIESAFDKPSRPIRHYEQGSRVSNTFSCFGAASGKES